jgi:hypothetical protein
MMLELLFVVLLVIAGLAALLVLPLLLIGLFFRVLFWIVVLPFRAIGALFGASVAVLGALGKAFVTLVAALIGLALFVGAVLVLPLVPIILVCLAIWGLSRLARRRPAYT